MKNRKIVLQALLCFVLVSGLIVPTPIAGASSVTGLVTDDRSIIHPTIDWPGGLPGMTLSVPQGQATPMVAAGRLHTAGLKSDGTIVALGNNEYRQCDVDEWHDIAQIAVGDYHTLGLSVDGTVVAAGWDSDGQCDAGGWTDIIQVAAGGRHTVGLKSDGTALAVGCNHSRQCDVGNWTGVVQIAAGFGHTVGLKSGGSAVAVGDNGYGQCGVDGWTDIIQVAVGGDPYEGHTVGVKSDGGVVALGSNHNGQCEVGGWTDIVQVAAGAGHTVGLKSDGRVVATGLSYYGQCDVGDWTDIVQIAAGWAQTVGLKSDGTVVAVGWGSDGQCDAGGWMDITQVAAGSRHTVGVTSDGSVVALGSNHNGQCEVGGWTDIVQVAAGAGHTVGLRSDGTVVAVGYNGDGQCNVGSWTDIVQITVGSWHTAGLKSDGTVVATGYHDYGQYSVDGWTDIVQVVAGGSHTLGLKLDGAVVATGYHDYGQPDVDNWMDIVQLAAGGAEETGYVPPPVIDGPTEREHAVGLRSNGTAAAVGYDGYGQCNVGSWTEIVQITAGGWHTVGLKSDGTVVSVGYDSYGQCSIDNWTEIVEVAADHYHTVGLRSDGTVVAAGLEVELAKWNLGETTAPPATGIRDWYDLDAIRNNLSGDYTLMHDLDSTTPGYTELASPMANGGKGWEPIGTAVDGFIGSLDGQGYEVKDMMIHRPEESNVGLFSSIGSGGIIENLGIVNVTVIGCDSVGALAGYSLYGGTVSNSYSAGSVTGSEGIGGLLGDIHGTVWDSHFNGTVVGVTSVGGLVGSGRWDSNIEDSYATGSVTGSEAVGGLVGAADSWGSVADSYSHCSVGGEQYVGGLIGFNEAPVWRCYSSGDVTGVSCVGGLIGGNYAWADVIPSGGSVHMSCSTGRATGEDRVGGLVGENSGLVINSYSTGDVIGQQIVGGLAGYNGEICYGGYDWPCGSGWVWNSYSTGTVAGASSIGGLVGWDDYEGGTPGSFWDVDTSGMAESDGGTGKSTAEMQDTTTFSDANWSIAAVTPGGTNSSYSWNIIDGETYPFLSWEQLVETHEIWDWYDLDAIRNDLGGSYVLMNNLDSATPGYTELAGAIANDGKGWEPIGAYDESDPERAFAGYFDGQGYEIRDLFIHRPDETNVGLFGCVDWIGVVRNVGAGNVTVTGGKCNVGAIAGLSRGTVGNCHSSGSVTGHICIGGLVGANNGIVSNSYASGSVSGHGYVGGLVGEHWGSTVSSSHFSGTVTGALCVGGLAGDSIGTITDSHSDASVIGESSVGGLVGLHWGHGAVTDSYYTGSVTGHAGVGGLVGFNDAAIRNSYYDYDEVLINGENILTIGALLDDDFNQWITDGKFLDIDERLSQEDGYYVIGNAGDFKELLAFGQDDSLRFRLKDDLDLSDDPDFYIPYLAGQFDGSGHKVSNLTFNCPHVSQVGLFGYLASGGEVSQVGVENVSMIGCWFVGALVGLNGGTVRNAYSTGSVTGDTSIGGLVGYSWHTVTNSGSAVTVIGNSEVGGLVGSNSFRHAPIVFGPECGSVSNSYSAGSVVGDEAVGGLVGANEWLAVVIDSFWDTQTSGQGTSSGGTGKTTAEMQDIATFADTATVGLDEPWDIAAVVAGETHPAYIWNIVDGQTYPFLSWGATLSHAPVARASDINEQPQVMYPDTEYTVTAKYFDPDGREDLKYCYLQLKYPDKPLTMMWDQATDDFWVYAGEEGENYLTVSGNSTSITEGGLEGYQLTWIFMINDQWPEVENAIDFGVYAWDRADLTSGWEYDDTKASFFRNIALEVTIRDPETESELHSAWVGEEFRIHVTSPHGWPADVRISIDDEQDGRQTGEWTEYAWDDLDAARWNEDTRTLETVFETGGPKEVWAEVDYGGEVTATDSTTAFGNFAFAHITDAHIGGNTRPFHSVDPRPEYWLAAALRKMNEHGYKGPLFVLVTGDIVETAYWKNLPDPFLPQGCHDVPYFQTFCDIIDEFSRIPVYTVPGNHDRYCVTWDWMFGWTYWPYDQEAGLKLYNEVLGDRRPGNAVTIGDPTPCGHNDYRFTYGGLEFIGIDSGYDSEYVPEYELKWPPVYVDGMGLEDDQLAALLSLDEVVSRILFMHHPLATEDNKGEIRENQLKLRYFMKTHNVQLVLAGHTHSELEYSEEYPNVITPATHGDGAGYRLIHVTQDENGAIKVDPQSVTPITRDEAKGIEAEIGSPVEFEVYDSDGRRVHISKDAILADEIPNAIYIPSPFAEAKNDGEETPLGSVLLFDIDQEYVYVVSGVESGTYTLSVELWNGSEESTWFMGGDIPCTNGSVHRYTIDWEALSRGEEGVTVQVDTDGDGEFERTISSDSDLTPAEFMLTQYLLLSDTGMVEISGSDISLNGSIHSNTQIKIGGGSVTISGTQTTSPQVTVPDMADYVPSTNDATIILRGDQELKGNRTYPDGSVIWVGNGKLEISGTVGGNVWFLVDKEIVIKGNLLPGNENSTIRMYSKEKVVVGDSGLTVEGIFLAGKEMTLSGSGLKLTGLFWGKELVDISGSNSELTGAVISNKLLKVAGSDFKGTYNPYVINISS